MKGITFLTVATVATTLTLTSCCNPQQSGRKAVALELFNGRNLDGWTHVLADPAVPREAVWSVKDGILICQGTPLGVLHTKQSFQNFRFTSEYRWAPGTKPGNSGILTRINGEPRALPRCAEVQLMNGSAGDVLGLQGLKVAAGQPRFFEIKAHQIAGDIAGVKKTAGAENPGGEWNRVEVLAEGGTYTVWVNGQQINQVTGVEVIAGPLGLQSEGGEIHFRTATLTPLPN
jgi:hypothetical protein